MTCPYSNPLHRSTKSLYQIQNYSTLYIHPHTSSNSHLNEEEKDYSSSASLSPVPTNSAERGHRSHDLLVTLIDELHTKQRPKELGPSSTRLIVAVEELESQVCSVSRIHIVTEDYVQAGRIQSHIRCFPSANMFLMRCMFRVTGRRQPVEMTMKFRPYSRERTGDRWMGSVS